MITPEHPHTTLTRDKASALFAVCQTCGTTMTPDAYWPLRTHIWLHQHGSCEGKKVRYYGWAI